MTPADIELLARNRYNSVNDTFWSQSEIMTYIYMGCMELVNECDITIERIYTTSTTANVQEYSFPTNCLGIKRITYDGKKLMPITMRDDDVLTLSNQALADSGSPNCYYTFNRTIYIRPLPPEVKTLEIFSLSQPQVVTSTSTLDVPEFMHPGIANIVNREMAAKDKNYSGAKYWDDLWQADKMRFKRQLRLSKRGDSFNIVQNEENHPVTIMGAS